MKNIDINKTSILYSPNRNYLGHQDLPITRNEKKFTLTIKSFCIEEIKQSQNNKIIIEEKMVMRFEEQGKEGYEWVKPFITNITNRRLLEKALKRKGVHKALTPKDVIGFKVEILEARDKGFEESIYLDNNEYGECITTRKKIQSNSVKCLRISDAEPVYISSDEEKQINSLIEQIMQQDKSYKIGGLLKYYDVREISKIFTSYGKELIEILKSKIEKFK